MPVSRSLARSRRHLSQRQENWFSMRPVEEMHFEGLINPNTQKPAVQEHEQTQEALHPAGKRS